MRELAQYPKTVGGGRYVLGPVLGQGGTAVVFEANDTLSDAPCAVKFLSPEMHARESVRERFRREARAMARLRHTHILTVLEVGVEDDREFVVMALAPGGSLHDVLAKGPLPTEQAVQSVLGVLAALSTAHELGVVHRDVKPENVLLADDGRALLADFGIARVGSEPGRTRTGVAMGSLAYMPPEQRLDAASVGPAADVYAAGCTLYALLTANNPSDLYLTEPDSPRWAAVPELLRPVIRKATTAYPEERYPSATAFAKALKAAWEDTDGVTLIPPTEDPVPVEIPVVPATEPVWESPAPTPANHTRWIPLVGLGLVAIAMVGCLGIASWRSTGSLPTTAQAFVVEQGTASKPTEARGTPVPTASLPDPEPPVPEAPHRPSPSEPVRTEPAPPPPQPTPVTVKDDVPTPEAQPEPKLAPPEVEPEPPAPEGTSTLTGTWSGALNAVQIDMRLGGSDDALRGNLETTWRSQSSRVNVAGSYDVENGSLVLTELGDGPNRATYSLSIAQDGILLRGRVLRESGDVRPIELIRSAP